MMTYALVTVLLFQAVMHYLCVEHNFCVAGYKRLCDPSPEGIFKGNRGRVTAVSCISGWLPTTFSFDDQCCATSHVAADTAT